MTTNTSYVILPPPKIWLDTTTYDTLWRRSVWENHGEGTENRRVDVQEVQRGTPEFAPTLSAWGRDALAERGWTLENALQEIANYVEQCVSFPTMDGVTMDYGEVVAVLFALVEAQSDDD
jgi:hypothetical protein